MENSKPKKEPPERLRLTRLYCPQKIGYTFFPHPLQAFKILFPKPINMVNSTNQAALHELRDHRFAKALNVHRSLVRKMLEPPLHLFRTLDVGATQIDLS